MSQAADESAKPTSDPAERPSMLVVDIGRHKRQQIKRLRKGKGKLLTKAQGAIDQLKSDKLVDQDAQVVVLVVREKRRRGFGLRR